MMLIRNNFLNIQGYDFFIHLISICTEDLVQRAHGAGQAARWWQSQTPLLLGTVSEDRYESSPQLTYTPLKLFIAVCLCVFVCVCVHPCINSACVSFGNADSQIGSQLQQWATQSLALDSIRCHLDNTATHCEVWARACAVLVCVFVGFHFTFQDFINIFASLCTLCISYASLCRQTMHCMCKLCMCDGVCLYLHISSVFFFDLWNSLGPSHTAASL